MGKTKYIICNDLCEGGGAESVFNVEAEAINKLEGVSVYKLVFKKNRLSFLYVWVELLWVIVKSKYLGNNIHVHVHNATTLSGIICLISLLVLKRIINFKQVHTVHDYALLCPSRVALIHADNMLKDVYPNKYVLNNRFSQSAIASFVLVVRYLVLRFITLNAKIDVVFSPSRHLASSFLNAYPNIIVSVLRNPIASLPTAQVGTIDFEYRGQFFIVGRLSQEKGVATALKYWLKHYPNTSLTVIGDGPELGNLKEISAGYKNVLFTGWIPASQVRKLIKGGVIFYSSIWTENAPVVFLDALFSGAKLLCLKHDACTLEFDRALPGLFVSNDADLNSSLHGQSFDVSEFYIDNHLKQLLAVH